VFFENKRYKLKWPGQDLFGGELDKPFDPFEALETQTKDSLPEQPDINVHEPIQVPPGEIHPESGREAPVQAPTGENHPEFGPSDDEPDIRRSS